MQAFTPPKTNSAAKAALIALRKQQAAAKASEEAQHISGINASIEEVALTRVKDWIKPEDAPERLRIVFDNSGSMREPKITAAKDGVVEFLRNCTPNVTSVGIHLLNPESEFSFEEETRLMLPTNIQTAALTSDIVLLASEIEDPSVVPTGGTPLYETLDKALSATPRATRIIAFSDGRPQGYGNKMRILNKAVELNIPIDTVYICDVHYPDYTAIRNLKEIAIHTGGIFLDLSKGDIKKGLKFLAPTKRLMLADSSFKSKVERGEV